MREIINYTKQYSLDLEDSDSIFEAFPLIKEILQKSNDDLNKIINTINEYNFLPEQKKSIHETFEYINFISTEKEIIKYLSEEYTKSYNKYKNLIMIYAEETEKLKKLIKENKEMSEKLFIK